MPIVHSKRKRQIEQELAYKVKRCKLHHYEMFSKIGFLGDHHHSLYREIPLIGVDFEKIVRKEVGSFLNGNGGIIAFGVRTNGTVLGNKLTRKEEDNFKLAVDRIMISFHPIVGPSMYRLIVEPVYDKYNSWVGGGLFLIQLKVNKGDQYSLYEDGEHEVYVRSGDSPKGPLTAREIKERVTAEYEQRRKENTKKEMEIKTSKENTTVPKTITAVPKTITTVPAKTVKENPPNTINKTVPVKSVVTVVKEGRKEEKTIPKTQNTKNSSGVVKIRRPLSARNK